MRKGYLLLTEGRSGSNWLGSMANATGRMGNLEEWVDEAFLGARLERLEPDAFIDALLDKAGTANGRFAVKLFPRHLYTAQFLYGFDLVRRLQREHDVVPVLLTRRDRLRQAVSFARGRMTRQWRSDQMSKGEARYDFDEICRCYFFIEQSYAFWASYLGLREQSHLSFVYEDLLPDPMPYFRALASRLDVEAPETLQTPLERQSDSSTAEWVERFRAELAGRDIVEFANTRRAPSRSLKNLLRLLRKQPMSPLPFHR